MTFSADKIADFDRLISESSNIVITAHKSPDGDSIGSSLGLYHYLASIGVDSKICHPDKAPDFLWWMAGQSDILSFENNEATVRELFEGADLIFCLDYNSPGRIGKLDELMNSATAKKIMIDHHRDPDMDFCDLVFSDYTNSSTSQMIYELMEAKDDLDKLNGLIGTPLYCGIIMDTGSFRFPSSSEKTHQVAAKLVASGVRHWEVHEAVFDNKTEDQIKLNSYSMLEKLVVRRELATSYISLSKEEQSRFNAKKGDTEGLVNQALAIQGVKMAVFFKESEGIIKMSFRSKGDIPVNDLARNFFEGGGHKNAAGGKFVGKLVDAIAKFERVLPDFQKENSTSFE